MPIVGINQPVQERKPSALEKVAMGLDIVSKLVGIPVSIYEAHTKRKQLGMDTIKEQIANIDKFKKEFIPAKPAMEGISGAEEIEPGKFEIKVEEPTKEERGAEDIINPETGLSQRVVRREVRKETEENENKLRNEFQDESKDFVTRTEAYGALQTALQRSIKAPPGVSKGAADRASTVLFMKVMDPRSIVTEKEQANVGNAAGVEAKWRNIHNMILQGETLTPELRKEMLRISKDIYSKSVKLHEGREKFYKTLASERGLNPSFVVRPVGFLKEDIKETQNQTGLSQRVVKGLIDRKKQLEAELASE